MKITINNYELFFTDYLDGNLSDTEIIELEEFLLLNPDLREELEGMEKMMLVPEKVFFTDKDVLKKPDTETPVSKTNFDDYCVAYFEGDLNEEKKLDLKKFINKHPEFEKEFYTYEQTILTPDLNISFRDREKLKKAAPVSRRLFIYTVLSAAASILLLMVIFWNTGSPDSVAPPVALQAPGQLEIPPPPDSPAERIAETSIESTEQHDRVSGITEPLADHTVQDHQEPVPAIGTEPPSITLAAITLPLPQSSGPVKDKISGLQFQDNRDALIAGYREPEYLSIPDIALKYVNTKVLKRDDPIIDASGLNIWEVADAGIKGINRVTGSEMKLEKREDAEGAVTAIHFDAGFFGFTRPVR